MSAAGAVSAAVPSVLLGGKQPCKRIINGLWQTSGGWSLQQVPNAEAVAMMLDLHRRGFTTFDAADHYGPAEDLLGSLAEQLRAESVSEFEHFSKWCPQPSRVTRARAEAAVNKSLARMKTPQVSVLQMHWWDYSMRKEMLECMHHVDDLRKEGKIGAIALTNFDTAHVELFLREGIPIVSNQVQFSLIDARPLSKMAPFCAKNGVQLLTYGTLAGGLLTDRWLGKPQPTSRMDLPTPSLSKYYNMIAQWGSWAKFQGLLATLRRVADRHNVSVANVATKWVLDQPSVAGVIVGLRAGLTEHAEENRRALSLELTDADRAEIEAVRHGNDLMKVIGDCGDEYRR